MKSLGYQEKWRDKDRRDLQPPQRIEQVHFEKPKEHVPFELAVDTDRLQDILAEEGVTKGRRIFIHTNYQRGVIDKVTEGIVEGNANLIKSGIDSTLEKARYGFILGTMQPTTSGKKDAPLKRASVIRLNCGNIYDVALLTSPAGGDQVINRLT